MQSILLRVMELLGRMLLKGPYIKCVKDSEEYVIGNIFSYVNQR